MIMISYGIRSMRKNMSVNLPNTSSASGELITLTSSSVSSPVASRSSPFLLSYLVHFPISLKFVEIEHRYPPEWWNDNKGVDLGKLGH